MADRTMRQVQQSQRVLLVACIALTGLAGGCATVTRGTMSDVSFQSTPLGANVLLSNSQTCVTPCELRISRKEEFTATFMKEGFKPATVEVKTRLSPGGMAAGAGNILIGGVVGVVADGVSGATLDHVPNPVTVTLAPAGSPRDSVVVKPQHQRQEPTS